MAYVVVSVTPALPWLGHESGWTTICYSRAKEFRQYLDAGSATEVVRRWNERMAPPTAPEVGQAYFNVNEDRLYRWSGTSWQQVGT